MSANSVARIGPRDAKGMDTAEIRKLSDLLELSRTLSSTLNLKAALARVLEILEENHRTLSGGIMLLDESTGELAIEAASGIDAQTARRARYKLGEGITGRVVQSGKPVVVPQVSQEPLFLNRTGVLKKTGRDEATFICVPIAADARPVGALGVTLPFEADVSYDRETKFFGIVASMVGQAVRVHRLIEAERQGLLQENRQLRQ